MYRGMSTRCGGPDEGRTVSQNYPLEVEKCWESADAMRLAPWRNFHEAEREVSYWMQPYSPPPTLATYLPHRRPIHTT